MKVFPSEILIEIFSHIVEQGSLSVPNQTQRVSRYWYNHINQSGFWKLVLSPSEQKKYQLWLVATIERMNKFNGVLIYKNQSDLYSSSNKPIIIQITTIKSKSDFAFLDDHETEFKIIRVP